MLIGREEEATRVLMELRGLPAEHPRVAGKIADIRHQIEKEHRKFGGGGFVSAFKETFLVRSNLRCVI